MSMPGLQLARVEPGDMWVAFLGRRDIGYVYRRRSGKWAACDGILYDSKHRTRAAALAALKRLADEYR